MSVIIKNPEGDYLLLTKGADNVMMDKINFKKSGKDVKEKL